MHVTSLRGSDHEGLVRNAFPPEHCCGRWAVQSPRDQAFGPFAAVLRYDAGLMIRRIREMPGGIRIFLVYALLILAGIGVSLRYVVDTAISAPVSPEGVVVMVLLAYT